MNKAIIACVVFCLLSAAFPRQTYAESADKSKKKAWVAGKVYDVDGTTPLEGLPIRLVNVENGKVTEEKTKEEGCYRFKNVNTGTYSVAVTYKGQDYLLPEKILVELLQKREVAVSICVQISDKDNSLILRDKNCHVCLGAGFPPLEAFLISGVSAVTGGIIGKGGGDEPIVSESRP